MIKSPGLRGARPLVDKARVGQCGSVLEDRAVQEIATARVTSGSAPWPAPSSGSWPEPWCSGRISVARRAIVALINAHQRLAADCQTAWLFAVEAGDEDARSVLRRWRRAHAGDARALRRRPH